MSSRDGRQKWNAKPQSHRRFSASKRLGLTEVEDARERERRGWENNDCNPTQSEEQRKSPTQTPKNESLEETENKSLWDAATFRNDFPQPAV